MARGLVLVGLLGTACGRLGFDIDVEPIGDGSQTGDALGGEFLSASTTCQLSPTLLSLTRDAQAGESLLVFFYMREPQGVAPTITGGSLSWSTDVSFSTTTGSNQRHLSIFRATLSSSLPIGTELAIAYGSAKSTGAAAFTIPGSLVRPTNEAAVTAEGDANPFSGSFVTAGGTAVCTVVHHNVTGATFAAGWNPFYTLSSICGGSRESAAMHLAVAAGGDVTCTGMLGNDFSWAVGLVGFEAFPL